MASGATVTLREGTASGGTGTPANQGGDVATLTNGAGSTFTVGGSGKTLSIAVTSTPVPTTVVDGSLGVAAGKAVQVQGSTGVTSTSASSWNLPASTARTVGDTSVVPDTLTTTDIVAEAANGVSNKGTAAVGNNNEIRGYSAAGSLIGSATASGTAQFQMVTTTPIVAAQTVTLVQQHPTALLQSVPLNEVTEAVAAPAIATTSAEAGDGDGTIEATDSLALAFSEPMREAGMGTLFDVSVSNATPNVITVTNRTTGAIVSTMTTTGVRYNTHATDAMTTVTAAAAWSNFGRTLTITLTGLTGGTAAITVAAHTSSYVAGAGAIDVAGNAASTTPVTGASAVF